MKVPYSRLYTSRMEENSALTQAVQAAAQAAAQNHQNGQPFAGVNVSLANNKHQPSSQELDAANSTAGQPCGPGQQGPNKDQNPQYTMPGVLHFLQHEWARFELERSQWELDRAEFQARIAFLQGERKGQENLKTDLVRRIKMLEYALKQERAKYHKLKFGTDLVIQGDGKPAYEEGSTGPESEGGGGGGGDSELPFSISNISWKQGRALLRQYLQEVGYTDTIIDVRSNRVRSLLGLNNNADSEDTNTPALNGNESSNKRANEFKNTKFKNSSPRKEGYKQQPSSIAEAMILDTEAAVMANFEFLAHTDIDMEEDENDGEEEIYDSNTDTKQNKVRKCRKERE